MLTLAFTHQINNAVAAESVAELNLCAFYGSAFGLASRKPPMAEHVIALIYFQAKLSDQRMARTLPVAVISDHDNNCSDCR